MGLLDPHIDVLTPRTAAHLLRRATFGPTQSEIRLLVGKTTTQAVQLLIKNSNFNPPPPVDLEESSPTFGQPFLQSNNASTGQYLPANPYRNGQFKMYIKYWWMALMTEQTGSPSLLDKLTLFWQNHFVATTEGIDEYRFLWSYLKLLRGNALGNFRDLVIKVSKEPGMIRYLNGDKNETGPGKANENYARELQELFVVGAVDENGKPNYTEDDVKEAARVLTGWNYTNFARHGSTTFAATFSPSKHDANPKKFSEKYKNKVISTPTELPRGYQSVGDFELQELVNMLLSHPHTPRFICRKLYRWYVSTTVTPVVEAEVIGPLATLFVKSNWNIQPVIEKLLTSQVFYHEANIGCMIKSPADFLIGATRFFNQAVPAISSTAQSYKNFFNFMYWRMRELQLDLLDQPSVFGYEPFYQTGYTKNWVTASTIAVRNDTTGALVWRWLGIGDDYQYGIDAVGWVKGLQTNFSDIAENSATPPGTPPITCTQVVNALLENLFATDLSQQQKDFLIDKIMMMDQSPRSSWEDEWNNYRRYVTHSANYTNNQIKFGYDVINWRVTTLMYYVLRMAEYHLV